jgi:hypothetical protein
MFDLWSFSMKYIDNWLILNKIINLFIYLSINHFTFKSNLLIFMKLLIILIFMSYKIQYSNFDSEYEPDIGNK